MIFVAVEMSQRVGIGVTFQGVSFGFSAGVISFFYVIGLGSLWFLTRPNVYFLILLIILGLYGLYKGPWRYYRLDVSSQYNADLFINPSFQILVFLGVNLCGFSNYSIVLHYYWKYGRV